MLNYKWIDADIDNSCKGLGYCAETILSFKSFKQF